LNATRHFVAMAQTDLPGTAMPRQARLCGRPWTASISYPSICPPLLAARINLERAEAHYGSGQKETAKADVNRAIAQLAEAGKAGDPDSQADVKNMLGEAQSCRPAWTSLGSSGVEGLCAAPRRMRPRHGLIRPSAGRLRQHDPLRSALIEAKRYVAYADIDATLPATPAKPCAIWQAGLAGEGRRGDGKAGQDAAVYVRTSAPWSTPCCRARPNPAAARWPI